MKDDSVYLDLIRDSIRKIDSYVGGMDEATFLADSKTQSAVMMQLTLIGELVKRLSKETKESIDLPWKDISGFRDRAVHNYFEIDLSIVWNTILEDLPVLKKKLS